MKVAMGLVIGFGTNQRPHNYNNYLVSELIHAFCFVRVVMQLLLASGKSLELSEHSSYRLWKLEMFMKVAST